MDGLLQQCEEETYHFSGFWKSLKSVPLQVNEPILISGHLRVKSPLKSCVSKKCSLTSEFLYLHSETTGRARKYAAIRWKLVEPFTEENASDRRYGFRLRRGLHFCDFYTEDETQLEAWLDCLAGVAVMSDFDNDYEIVRQLGRGGHATVYLGKARHGSELVAVKAICKKEIEKNRRELLALASEVNLMKRLSHPRIIKLLGMYENDTELRLVLEYAGNGDLFRRLNAKGKFPESRAAVFAFRLFEALNYMHSHDVVHRDLKPENLLLVTDDTDFRIADFGLAGDCQSERSLSMRCGSPGYVAPEIFGKQTYDTKVDVFSAGVVLYIILSGRSPFSASDNDDLLANNRECEVRFPPKHWSGVSREAVSLVAALTEKNPQRRLTAREALRHPWFRHLSLAPPAKAEVAMPLAPLSHQKLEAKGKDKDLATDKLVESLDLRKMAPGVTPGIEGSESPATVILDDHSTVHTEATASHTSKDSLQAHLRSLQFCEVTSPGHLMAQLKQR